MKKKQKTKKELWGKKQVFLINATPYKQDIVVVLNGQFSDAEKYMKKLGGKAVEKNLKHIRKARKQDKELYADDYELQCGKARTYHGLPVGYVVLLSHENGWIETVNSVTHEMIHIGHYVLKRAGIELNDDTQEAYTYLVAHLTETVLRHMYD